LHPDPGPEVGRGEGEGFVVGFKGSLAVVDVVF
jgi:hypothetical protein